MSSNPDFFYVYGCLYDDLTFEENLSLVRDHARLLKARIEELGGVASPLRTKRQVDGMVIWVRLHLDPNANVRG